MRRVSLQTACRYAMPSNLAWSIESDKLEILVWMASRSFFWTSGFWHKRYTAQVKEEAVVSWPAAIKVIILSTNFSSANPPDSRATEMMSGDSASFLSNLSFLAWINWRAV